MTTTPWGHHLILDVSDCDKSKITDPVFLAQWVKGLVKEIDMVAYGEPMVTHFGTEAEHLTGWTVIQLITTSNINAHFNDNSGSAYIDVFSCKEYDASIVLKNINENFKPSFISQRMFTRQAL
jgi:S-adenosylmethionine/arginine decarboxylase-like enzyme